MKKNLTRTLAIMLVAMMLIPAISTLAVSADEIATTITPDDNIYKLAAKNAKPSDETQGEVKSATGQFASEPFAISKGVTIYFGPCPAPTDANHKKMDFLVAYYNKSGKFSASRKLTEMGTNIVGEFADGSVIYQLKISSTSYKAAAIRGLAEYADFMLVTLDKPFTVEDYYAYADSQGWDIDGAGLRVPPPAIAEDAPEGYEGLWNYFPRKTDRDATIRQHNNNTYISSDYIPVTAGDLITMGAINTKETRSILYAYDADFNEIKQYRRTDVGIDFVENIGYDYAIYSHTVPTDVAYVKVSVHQGVYNDGDTLVTKNQQFNGAELREALGIDDLSEEAKAHPFYGKNALFVGDSISYGSYDTPPSYRNPSASWARRLALATGLIPTNVSYPGASVGKTGLSNVKWEYDLLKTAMMTTKTFDIIVFQGGVNDARKNVAAGIALPADTDRKDLVDNDYLATFAGGLQLMFHDAKAKWPDADLYYIANFKLVSDSVSGKDMDEYYEQARILCAEYGVHYIDLYNDVELYETFDYESESILPDLIHPVSASYDILFPAILRLFNEALAEQDDPTDPDIGGNTPDVGGDSEETTTTPTPGGNTPNNNNSNNSNTNEESKPAGLGIGAIIGIAVGAAVVVAAGGFALYKFVIKKKQKNA